MKTRAWILSLACGVLLIAQCAAQSFTYVSIDVPCSNCPGGLAQTTAYGIIDLGTLGGDNSIPYWITNTGDVIGVSDIGQFGNPIDHAFRWSKGLMHDLGTVGDVNSVGLGGNNEGAAVGDNWYNINHTLLWYNGLVADLGTLVGPGGYGWAQQINNAAQIVGGSVAAIALSRRVF